MEGFLALFLFLTTRWGLGWLDLLILEEKIDVNGPSGAIWGIINFARVDEGLCGERGGASTLLGLMNQLC